MRELYATELCSGTDRNATARTLVDDWINRHTQESSSAETVVAENHDGSCTITLRQVDEASCLEWRSDVSLGPPAEMARVTVRIRLGSLGGGPIAPIDYEFGTPAIVRTLLREIDIRDASVRCAADLGVARHAEWRRSDAMGGDGSASSPPFILRRCSTASRASAALRSWWTACGRP